jgi:hypothetical protein
LHTSGPLAPFFASFAISYTTPYIALNATYFASNSLLFVIFYFFSSVFLKTY